MTMKTPPKKKVSVMDALRRAWLEYKFYRLPLTEQERRDINMADLIPPEFPPVANISSINPQPINSEPSPDLSNFLKWSHYLKDIPSPQSYVDFGFYYLIAASLQRRVWLPPAHKPCYANQYTILVGDAGLGKGRVIGPVLEILKWHKQLPPSERKFTTEEDGAIKTELTDAAADINYRMAKEEEDGYGISLEGKKKESFERPLLIHVAADATTYEALIRSMSRALRRKDWLFYDPATGKQVPKIYTHSSLAFCLEEISSLFRSKAQDVAKFLLNTYDCGDYEYDTKTAGRDRIRKCCLNFFGGTTPSFMQDVFSDKLLTDGFASRTWFIFETKNRDTPFFIPPLDSVQEGYKKNIIDHVKKLTNLYGECTLGTGVVEFLETWWREEGSKRINQSLKMDSYYARKKVHIMKMAMAVHFGESTDMCVPVTAFQRAIVVLEQIELNMHYALSFDNKNPLYHASNKAIKYLSMKPKLRATYKELLVEIFPDLPRGKVDFDEMMSYLLTTNKITSEDDIEGEMKTVTKYYKLNGVMDEKILERVSKTKAPLQTSAY